MRISRADLALALQGITTRIVDMKITEVALAAVGKIENIDFVVLSGGSSLTNAVRNGVLSIFRHLPEQQFILPDPSKPEDIEMFSVQSPKGWRGSRRMGFHQLILASRR